MFVEIPYSLSFSRAQERYNGAHTKTRCIVERTFGRWKRRFHVLHSEIRLEPSKVCKVIIACGVLHNFAIMQGEILEDSDDYDDMGLHPHGEAETGTAVRDLITNRFFS